MAERARLVCASDAIAEAGALLAESVRSADSERGRARLAIPGGSALAALAPARGQLGAVWRRILLTWVDERCVSFGDARSNRGAAYRSAALDSRDPPAELLPLFQDLERASDAIERVEAALAARFAGEIDVALLGMGADGHVGSLFPGALEPTNARVAFVRSSPQAPAARITLTRRMLATAKSVVLLALGEAKRGAIERVLDGDAALPASGLSGLVIVTDLELGWSESQ